MISAPIPHNEKQRQLAVNKYQLLDTLPEESYDNITSLMAYICDVPVSLITLLDKDRNFLKSHHGIPFNESPREISFCGHAINSESPITIIENTLEDERFYDNPLVKDFDIAFYAGVPLIDPEGYKLGTLCIYDTKARSLSQEQINALLGMAKQVVSLFEEKYQNIKLQQLHENLEERNKNLEKFAGIVSHDLKSPLAQIIALTELLEDDLKDGLSQETQQYLEYIKSSSGSLKNYIDGILKFYKTDNILKHSTELLDFSSILREISTMFINEQNIVINFSQDPYFIDVNKAALTQLFVNLISNAIKYNDKPNPTVTITLEEDDDFYTFGVSDNGPGIPSKYLESIFDLFTTVKNVDKNGDAGTGIGLATVKKVVSSLGGEISVTSKIGVGSDFSFTISKTLTSSK